ncbi:metabolite traffic protein EboE [Actinacidiphila paucisporea]|uniref:Xylose isomerase-like TIM barrel n=1 Tax=Actinacidiphila paucisporea TaxID=310782 RepID=A0A1M7PM96_9ACTN|nr:metabolite traffic protein EboE [Actinacidiphila paucisporea]SHN18301.1 Xylose isomerase-like TIM barrel [Actinacidiphila paucisporea]
MRLRHRDGQTVHLGYCTNVHAGEELPEIIDQLDTYAVTARKLLGTDRLGVGLWLAAPVAARLAADPGVVARLRHDLDVRGLDVVTCNGFPYRAFHAPVVKHAVYRPDWLTDARMDYTADLALVLAGLLPDDAARGSVSTLPLAWRTPWTGADQAAARRRLAQLADRLAAVHARTGRLVRVGFEAEPGCVMETTEQVATGLAGVDTRYLGVCLDLAHLACAWEEPAAALARLSAAGLPVVKVQVSAALAAEHPQEPATAAALRSYAEPRFLHQTRSAAGHAADDLDEALDASLPGPWRVHYHVPLHADPQPPLRSTVDVLRAALAEIVGGERALCDHLEVETYTWNVLPPDRRPAGPAELAEGIAAELAFTRGELLALGLHDRPVREMTR